MKEKSSTNFDIKNIKNYKKRLYFKNASLYSIEYIKLMSDFLAYASENMHIQNKQYYLFVIKRGLETFSHVFMFLLMYTKNIELVSYHCKKSFFYYIEFIGQISDDVHTYLQLNSKDATLFVYKKTVFEINNDIKKNNILIKEEKKVLKFISKVIIFYNKYILYCFRKSNFSTENKEFVVINYISSIKKLFDKFFKNKTNLYKKIKIILYFFHVLETLDIDICAYLSILDIFCRKNIKLEIDKKQIREKIFSRNANLFIKHYTPLKFINWLFAK